MGFVPLCVAVQACAEIAGLDNRQAARKTRRDAVDSRADVIFAPVM